MRAARLREALRPALRPALRVILRIFFPLDNFAISNIEIEMKPAHWFAIFIAILAVILTGLGGVMDSWKGRTIKITKEHAWNDGTFLILLAIFIVIVT
jgi:hypothetical protein